MVDPISLGAIALGAGGGFLASKSMSKAAAGIPAPPAPVMPPGLAPSSSPNSKPQKKSGQSSFMSGAAAASLAPGTGSTGGKTLLGA